MQAKITSKGQVTIPKKIREAMDLKAGDKIAFIRMDNGRVEMMARNKPAERLKGIVPKPEKPATLEEIKSWDHPRSIKAVIGLDTNVLLRYVVEDDVEQTKLANNLIAKCNRLTPAFISFVVLAEFTWTLRSIYKCNRAIIATLLEHVLEAEKFEHENLEVAKLALTDYEDGNADYADCIISRLSEHSDCKTTYTFDKKASKLPHNTLLK